MRVAGVREFRNHAPQLVKSKDIVFVTRHGKLTSLLVPLAHAEMLPVELRRELLVRIGESISSHLRKRGITENDVIRDFKAWRKTRRDGRRRR